jgi:hypothetical protein
MLVEKTQCCKPPIPSHHYSRPVRDGMLVTKRNVVNRQFPSHHYSRPVRDGMLVEKTQCCKPPIPSHHYSRPVRDGMLVTKRNVINPDFRPVTGQIFSPTFCFLPTYRFSTDMLSLTGQKFFDQHIVFLPTFRP